MVLLHGVGTRPDVCLPRLNLETGAAGLLQQRSLLGPAVQHVRSPSGQTIHHPLDLTQLAACRLERSAESPDQPQILLLESQGA